MESFVNTVRNPLERNANGLKGFWLIDAVVSHRPLDTQCVHRLGQFIVDGGVARKVTETVGFAFDKQPFELFDSKRLANPP